MFLLFSHTIAFFHHQEGLPLEAVSWCSAGKSCKDRSLVSQPRDLDETVPTVQQTLSSTLLAFQLPFMWIQKRAIHPFLFHDMIIV